MDHWLNGCSSVIWYRQTNYLAKRENEEKKKNIGYVWIGSKIGVWLNRSNQPLIASERWNWGNTKYIFFFGEGSKKPIILSPIRSTTFLRTIDHSDHWPLLLLLLLTTDRGLQRQSNCKWLCDLWSLMLYDHCLRALRPMVHTQSHSHTETG